MSEQSTAPATTRVAPVSRPVVYNATAVGQPPPPDTGVNPDTGEKIEILRVPGVTAHGGVFVVPENAWTVFERVIRTEVGAELVARRVGPTVPAAPTVESFLNEHRLRANAIDFIRKTPFQAEGIRRGCLRDGFALHHPPGCLAGSTELVVNRGGAARRMKLFQLVASFNGGENKGHRWDLSIPTYTQSIDEEGTVRLNRIHAAVASGTKTTWCVRVGENRQIRATLDHRFFTPEGWRSLSDLKRYDLVGIVRPAGGHRLPRPKAYYRYVYGLTKHPFVVRKRDPRQRRQVFQVAEHRLIAEADLNGLSFEEFVGRVFLGRLDGLKFLGPEFSVHHKDEDPANNALSNLQVLQATEHQRLHGSDDGYRNVLATQQWTRIQAIEDPREEKTYDLTMESPWNNYVANRLVVHNSGKTLSALAWLAADDDRQPVIVTTAKARWQYGSQIERFTSWHPIIVEGEKPDEFEWKDPDGKDYKGKLPHNRDFPIIVPWPLLPFWISRLRAFKPRRVVFDESHSPGAKSHSRWTPVVTRSGRMSYAQKKNVSSSAMQLSQMASVAARLATSATPVRDRQSDLWAQLDLIEPGAWGSYWVWAKAYCAAKEGAWGGMDDSGRSGSDELRERMDVVRHLVQLSEALKDLPPTRREVVRLYADQQNRAVAGFGREIRKAKKFGAQALLEARLAFAASRKREWIAERAAEMVASGQKVLIFTGRRADVSALAESIGKTLRKNLALKFENPEEWFGRFEMGPALLYATHGDHSDKQRSEFAVEYFERKTHACLVATVDSMGESIDLQTTDWTCWAMLPYTPGQLKQGEGRGRRLGQDRSMLVTYVVAMKTIDEHVAGILLDKLPAVSGTVGDQDAEELANVLDGIDEIEVMSRLHARVMQEIAEEEGTG